MRHAGADVGEDLHDVIFHVVGRECPEEFEELNAHIVACVEKEWEKRRKHDTNRLRERGIYRARSNRCGEVGERIAPLAIGFGREEGEVVCELTL